MIETRLLEPTLFLEKQFMDFMNDWKSAGEKPVPFILNFDHSNFGKYIQTLLDFSHGIGIPEGFVPHSTYWLVAENKLIGVSNMRHILTPKLLKEGGNIGYGIRPSERRKGFATIILRDTLDRAKSIGLSKVLLTCDKINQGSVKTILNNNGILDSEELIDNKIIQRYWINL